MRRLIEPSTDLVYYFFDEITLLDTIIEKVVTPTVHFY